MPIANAEGGKDFELADTGSYSARCIRVVDLGTQIDDYDKNDIKDVRKVMVTWEISEKMEDGRPFVVSQNYTLSIGDRANLGKMLVSWRAKPFTEEEKKAFDLNKILDIPCMMSVTVSKDGKYNNIGGVLPLPKGMPVNDRANDLFEFDIEELAVSDKTDKLWPYEKYFLRTSKEYLASGSNVLAKKEDNEQSAQASSGGIGDEDIPF